MAQWTKHLPAMQEMKGDLSNPQVGKIPWRKAWQPPPVFSPGESPGQKDLVGDNPWGHKESDSTDATEHTCMRMLLIWDYRATGQVLLEISQL